MKTFAVRAAAIVWTQFLGFVPVGVDGGAGAEARGPLDDVAAGVHRDRDGSRDSGPTWTNAPPGPMEGRRGRLAGSGSLEQRTRRINGQTRTSPAKGSVAARALQQQTFSGNLNGAPTPTGNPDCGQIPEYCANGCHSLWYSVLGTGGPMSASSCGAADYDQVIYVFEGGRCSSLACIGTTRSFMPHIQI
jgi:hypothetical protein